MRVERWESGGYVGHALVGLEGVDSGGQEREGYRGEEVGAFGETSAGAV